MSETAATSLLSQKKPKFLPPFHTSSLNQPFCGMVYIYPHAYFIRSPVRYLYRHPHINA